MKRYKQIWKKLKESYWHELPNIIIGPWKRTPLILLFYELLPFTNINCIFQNSDNCPQGAFIGIIEKKFAGEKPWK